MLSSRSSAVMSDSESVSASPGPSSSFVSVTGRPRKSVVWEYFLYHSETSKSTCQILACASNNGSCGCSVAGNYPTSICIQKKIAEEIERKFRSYTTALASSCNSVSVNKNLFFQCLQWGAKARKQLWVYLMASRHWKNESIIKISVYYSKIGPFC